MQENKTRYLKESEKGVSEMCKAMEDLRNESYAEGKIEGKIEGKNEGKLEQAKIIAFKLSHNGNSIADIANLVGYSEEDVSRWLATPKIL